MLFRKTADKPTMISGAGYFEETSMDISMSIKGWNICSATITREIITHTIIKRRIRLRYLTYSIFILTGMKKLDMSTLILFI